VAESAPDRGEDLPFVTVIMPVRDESRYIVRSLTAVLEQDYPRHRLEVIVADGMSTDETRQKVRALQASHSNIKLIDNPERIASTGLNRAMAIASGTVIARVDGHCEIAPDYIRRAVQHLQNDGIDGVGGPIETVGETPTAAVIAAVMSSVFGVGGSAFRTVKDRTMLTDTIVFPVYTRAIIERAGGYDAELVRNQDDEYNYRLRKLGARLLLASDVRSRYYCRRTVRSLCSQYFQYGFWKVRVLRKHPRQMSIRQFGPPVFVAALIGSIGLGALSPAGWWSFVAVGGSYLLANATASLLVALRSERRTVQLLLLPVVFAAFHVSYGLGFLLGFVRFGR